MKIRGSSRVHRHRIYPVDPCRTGRRIHGESKGLFRGCAPGGHDKNWWLTYPSEKYESNGSVVPNIWKKCIKMFQTTNQKISFSALLASHWLLVSQRGGWGTSLATGDCRPKKGTIETMFTPLQNALNMAKFEIIDIETRLGGLGSLHVPITWQNNELVWS